MDVNRKAGMGWMVGAAMLVAVAGCTSTAGPDLSSAAPATSTISAASPSGAPRELWRDGRGAVHSLASVQITGDDLVLTGYPENPYEQYSPETVEVVDADTGASRWHRDVQHQPDIGDGRTLFALRTVAVGVTALVDSTFAVSEAGVAGGRIAVSATVGSSQLVDRRGRPIGSPVGGYIRLFTERLLVTGSGSGDTGFTVYAIG